MFVFWSSEAKRLDSLTANWQLEVMYGIEGNRCRVGRTATFSAKFALEHLGLGPCYHMTEVFCRARRNIPLWLDVVSGKPDWDTIFDGYQSTTDYPACSYWRELVGYYPDAKVVLSVRG